MGWMGKRARCCVPYGNRLQQTHYRFCWRSSRFPTTRSTTIPSTNWISHHIFMFCCCLFYFPCCCPIALLIRRNEDIMSNDVVLLMSNIWWISPEYGILFMRTSSFWSVAIAAFCVFADATFNSIWCVCVCVWMAPPIICHFHLNDIWCVTPHLTQWMCWHNQFVFLYGMGSVWVSIIFYARRVEPICQPIFISVHYLMYCMWWGCCWWL